MDPEPLTDLERHLTELIVELEGVEIVASPEGRACRFDGTTFAILGSGVAAFRLEPAIAAAAARTPDTRPAQRGAGWIEFQPAAFDDHALDRAEAWLISAWRHAASRQEAPGPPPENANDPGRVNRGRL